MSRKDAGKSSRPLVKVWGLPRDSMPFNRSTSAASKRANFGRLLGIFVAGAALSCHAEEPSATPYRPSVSSPASLPAPRHLELEGGYLSTQPGDAATRESAVYLLKYAFTDRFGLLLGGDAFVSDVSASGERARGLGDTNLTAKLRFPLGEGETPALGLEAGVKLPTAKRGLGSDERDYTANGILSIDPGEFHSDLNVNVTRLGAVEPGQGRELYGWAASVSHPLFGNAGWVAEFSGTTQRNAERTAQFLAAVSYNVSRQLVLDAGAARGLNSDSPRWKFFTGFTWLVD
jgi:hypothetical protein